MSLFHDGKVFNKFVSKYRKCLKNILNKCCQRMCMALTVLCIVYEYEHDKISLEMSCTNVCMYKELVEYIHLEGEFCLRVF